MALINCPECNKEISDKVINCPHCGYPLVSEAQLKKNSATNLAEKVIKKKKAIIISLLAVLGFVAILITYRVHINNVKLAKVQKEKAEINILFKDSITMITNAGNNATDTCSIILDVWSNAKSRDFNEVFKYMFTGDIKDHEYSGLGMDKQGFSGFSWGNTAEKMNSFKGRLDALDKEKADVDSKLQKIKQIKSDEFEKELDAIVSYYNSYLKLYNAATKPSGNQLNYSANLVQMKSEFNSDKVKLDMLIK